LYGFQHETLDAKVRYMLSLSLAKRYEQGLAFAEFMHLLKKDRDYQNVKKSFRTVQIVKKK